MSTIFSFDYSNPVTQALIGLGVVAGVVSVIYDTLKTAARERELRERIDSAERQVRQHPEKPQLAWDLARTKLESYLDRNLGQVRSIFWLTLFVMMVGFCFVLYGLNQAFSKPEALAVAIVASASGVITTFIGGSFLLIYRSILAHSKEYVMVLERINAVGMAVQVISNIPDEQAQLKHETTSALAKQLLGLYRPSESADSPRSNDDA